MARSAKKIDSLLDDEPELADALAVIVEAAGGDGAVEWADVSDDITSGQWGRLIEQEVLVDANGGFEIADLDAVESALEERGIDVQTADPEAAAADDDDGEDASWSKWDKLAAVGSVVLIASYQITGLRNTIGSTVDLFLGPVDQILPFYLVIIVLAVLTGTWSTLLQGYLLDTEKLSKYQERMEEIKEKRERAKEAGDEERMKEIQQEQMEAMGDNLGMFKLQFRPMVWTMLITIPIFLWMYWKILPSGGGTVIEPQAIVMPFVGELTSPGPNRTAWQARVLGPVQAWLVWYFLCSMVFGQLIRKTVNIQISPST